MEHLSTPLAHWSTEQLEQWLRREGAAADKGVARGIRAELARRQAADDDQRRIEEGDDQRDYAEERAVETEARREAEAELADERDADPNIGRTLTIPPAFHSGHVVTVERRDIQKHQAYWLRCECGGTFLVGSHWLGQYLASGEMPLYEQIDLRSLPTGMRTGKVRPPVRP